MTLGVRHHHARAALSEPLHDGWKLIGERTRRGLEQHPKAAVERHGAEMIGVEAVGGELRHLAARRDAYVDPETVELALQLGDARGQLLDAHVVVVADVRRGAHHGDSVALRHARHRDAVGEIERAVVERREYVAVQVDEAPAPPLG